MSLLGKLLSLFGGGSSTDAKSEPEPEPEPEPDEEPEAEEGEAEDEDGDEAEDDAMHSGELAAAADPRRDPDEDDTVADRAANPDDHAA